MPSPDSHKKQMTEPQVTPVTTKPEAKTAKAAAKPKAKPKRTSATKAKTASTSTTGTSTTPVEAKDTTTPTTKTEKAEKPTLASALGSARLATTTKKALTAKEMDAKLEEKLTKAHAGQAVPETDLPTSENPAPWTQAHGEASGLPPITTVRPMPEVTVKAPKKTATKKATAKAPAKATTKATPKNTTAAKPKAASPVASQPRATATQATAEPTTQTREDSKVKPTAKATATKKAPAKKASSTSTTAKTKKPAQPKATTGKTADNVEKADAKEASSTDTGLLATLINVAPSGIDDAVAKAKTTSNETAEMTSEAPIAKSLKKVDQPIKPEDVPQEGQTLAFLADDGMLPIDDEEAAAQKDTKVSKKTTTAPIVAEPTARPQAPTTSKTIVLNTLDDDSDDDDDEPFMADADDTIDTNDERRYHDTVTLTGRRAPVKGQIKDPDPVLPKTVNLEEERIAAQAVAKATLDRRHAERLVKRDELEARLSKRGLKAMCRESGIPEDAIDQLETHQLIQKRDVKTDHAPLKTKEQRNLTEGINPLWRNDAVRACNEHLERTTAIRPPVYNFAAGGEAQPTVDPLVDPRVAAAQQYAEAMVAWENQVIGESKTDRLLSPDRDIEPGKRIPVVTPANETLGGFPGAKDMRPWVSVSGKPAQTMPLTLGEKVDLYRYKANRWLSRWQALDALLRTSLVALGCAIVAAATSVSTSYWLVPDLTWRHTPVTVTALVADDEIRDLMMLVSLLETQKVDIGRTSPTVNRAYLPTVVLDRLANDTPDVRKTLPLDDALLRAAITEVSNRVGAPVISKRMVLATPESTYHAVGRTLDVTDDVIDLLGLTGVSAAAAKEALNGLMSPNGKPVTEKLQSDRLSGRIPLGQLTTPEK